ncbi:MAG: hypothetical protein V8S89_00755 [Oscillospiraceae bacterium]
MYRFPLLLALTGLVLLLLHWALGFASMDAFGELLPLVWRNWYILVLPVVLLLLYLFRAPVAAAYGGAAVGAVLFLIQLVVSFLLRRSGGDAVGLAAWIPGHGLFSSLQALAAQVSAASILAFAADLALVLCNASTIFSCMGYVSALRQATERATQRQARQDAEKDFSLED